MIDFTVLAPDLDTTQAKLLRAALTQTRLPYVEPIDTLTAASRAHVLSVGRAALDTWHDFGLIRVGYNHGDTFTHRSLVLGRTFTIMVLEHPGTLQQLSIVGHAARDNMVRDSQRWRVMLDDDRRGHLPRACGGCMKARAKAGGTGGQVIRRAEHWAEELDGVGLCEDHWRARGKYARKRVVVPVKDRGKMEWQIKGQREMFGGDGTKVMVDKT